MGYYCVDNLPLDLLPQLIQILSAGQPAVAISLDIRNLPTSPQILENTINDLQQKHNVKIIFLDADTGTLIRR